MSWSLKVWTPDGATLLNTFTDLDATPGVHGGFKAIVRGNGDCVSLEFRGRNDVLQIGPRSIVQFLASDPVTQLSYALFWGVIIRNPELDSPGAGPKDKNASGLEVFKALGGRELLNDRRIGARFIDGEATVTDIFREFVYLYKHPAVTFTASEVQVVTDTLTMYYKPTESLSTVLDELVSTLNVDVDAYSWGVDSTGTVFMNDTQTSTTVDAADVLDLQRFGIDSEDTISKVKLVIAGGPAGKEPNRVGIRVGGGEDDQLFVDHLMQPIIYEYTHPEHGTYGTEIAMELPDGVNPFLKPSDAAAFFGGSPAVTQPWTNPERAYDDNGSTFADTDGPGGGSLTWFHSSSSTQNPVLVGFRLIYEKEDFTPLAPEASIAHVRISYYSQETDLVWVWGAEEFGSDPYTQSLVTRPVVMVDAYYDVPDTPEGVINNFYAVLLPDARNLSANNIYVPAGNEGWNIEVELDFNLGADGVARIYWFYPLVLDTALLDSIGKANAKVPGPDVGQITASGYYAPATSVTAEFVGNTGSSVGSAQVGVDVTLGSMGGEVELVEYNTSKRDGYTTKFTFGDKGLSEYSRAVLKASNRLVDTRNYGLKLGARV